MPDNVNGSSKLGEVISDRMAETGLTIKDLSEKLDITYEHSRRLVRGEGIPSGPLLRIVAQELHLDFKELEKLAKVASIYKRYGNVVPLMLAGRKPDMEPIERVWDYLTTDQKKDAITMIQGWAKRGKLANV